MQTCKGTATCREAMRDTWPIRNMLPHFPGPEMIVFANGIPDNGDTFWLTGEWVIGPQSGMAWTVSGLVLGATYEITATSSDAFNELEVSGLGGDIDFNPNAGDSRSNVCVNIVLNSVVCINNGTVDAYSLFSLSMRRIA